MQNQINNMLDGKGGFNLMDKYALQPVAKGMLKNTSTLDCCNKPSNSARTGSKLKKGINVKLVAKPRWA